MICVHIQVLLTLASWLGVVAPEGANTESIIIHLEQQLCQAWVRGDRASSRQHLLNTERELGGAPPLIRDRRPKEARTQHLATARLNVLSLEMPAHCRPPSLKRPFNTSWSILSRKGLSTSGSLYHEHGFDLHKTSAELWDITGLHSDGETRGRGTVRR